MMSRPPLSMALALALCASTAQAAPGLTITGSCPGDLRVAVDVATPGGTVLLAGADDAGTTAIANGPCPGLELDIAGNPRVLGTRTADAAGAVRLFPSPGAGPCGLWIQSVDVATCETSNAVELATICADDDLDGVCDTVDACPGFDDTQDADADGIPDGCDLCLGDNGSGDVDGDGVCADIDICDDRFNPNQEDVCNVWFVDDDATGDGSGTSWADAFTTVQAAVAAAEAGDEVWIAEGVYRPTAANAPLFNINFDLDVYGAFAGTEMAVDARTGTPENTVLSGDFLGNDDVYESSYDDNARPVGALNTGASAVFDGLTIAGGTRDSGSAQSGAGISATGFGTASFTNMIFRDNRYFGISNPGALHLSGGTATIRDSLFIDNFATRAGAGVMIRPGTGATIVNTSFIRQSNPGWLGAAVWATYGSDPVTIANCSFAWNTGTNVVSVKDTDEVVNTTLFAGAGAAQALGGGVARNVCADQDLGGTNVFLDGSTAELGDPFVLDGDRLLLSHYGAGQAFTSACVDAGDSATADADLPGWQSMTTRTDGGADLDPVDPARHY